MALIPTLDVSVRLSVRSLFEVPFKRLFAPTSQSRVLEIPNCLGKVMERSDLRLKKFTNKGCKIAAHFFKTSFLLIVSCKVWRKPHFLWLKGVSLILAYI